MKKVLKFLDDHFEEYLLIGSFFVTVSVIFLQVVCRYVFHHSLTWSEELARYIFVWQIWLGAAYAAKINKHINITVAREKFPNKVQVFLEFFADFLWAAFSIFMVLKGRDLLAYISRTGQLAPALRISMSIPYSSVPIGCGLMGLRVIEGMVKKFPNWKERWAK